MARYRGRLRNCKLRQHSASFKAGLLYQRDFEGMQSECFARPQGSVHSLNLLAGKLCWRAGASADQITLPFWSIDREAC